MSKVLVTLGLVVAVLSGAVAAQSRPDFSGRWDWVADKSTPSGPTGVFGKSFGLQQTGTSLTIETTEAVATGSTMTVTANGEVRRGAAVEGTVTRVYTLDGAEHELQLIVAPQEFTGNFTRQGRVDSYRAIWTTGQLVIITTRKAGAAGGADPPGQLQWLRREALSLDSDGSLIVDYITIVPPAAGAARQAPPMTIRSVYAKSKGTTTELDGVWIVQSAERNGQPMPLPGNGMVMWSGGTPTPCASDVRITFKGWLPQLQCPLAA